MCKLPYKCVRATCSLGYIISTLLLPVQPEPSQATRSLLVNHVLAGAWSGVLLIFHGQQLMSTTYTGYKQDQNGCSVQADHCCLVEIWDEVPREKERMPVPMKLAWGRDHNAVAGQKPCISKRVFFLSGNNSYWPYSHGGRFALMSCSGWDVPFLVWEAYLHYTLKWQSSSKARSRVWKSIQNNLTVAQDDKTMFTRPSPSSHREIPRKRPRTFLFPRRSVWLGDDYIVQLFTLTCQWHVFWK